MNCTPLPVVRMSRIPSRPPNDRWLVEGLWGWPAVGFVAGTPKSLKTWMALELAIAVASGRPCLGRYAVHKPGHVLVYAAEDTAQAVRERVEAIATARTIDLDALGVGLITEPALRLDNEEHKQRLSATLDRYRPRLLVLDPLVRLHSGDENSSSDISQLLGFLRRLQREHDVAILLVHHVRKTPASQPGQALRGSGDLHAWLDSSLYLLRRKGRLVLQPEHRDNPGVDPVEIGLDPEGTHLVVKGTVEGQETEDNTELDARVLEALTTRPMTRTALP